MAAFRYDIATTVPPDDDEEDQQQLHQHHQKRVRKRGTHNHNKIETLPKEVVDRIAAGEVIQRPVNVVKELIENSLDADSTHIEVQVTAGGLRLLSVTDDGIGIHPRDLALAATRFATSKLCAFDDLKSIRTFGFRGEALASASMVARLSIASKLRFGEDMGGYSTSCAYKQSYRDSHPVAPKPTPAAGKGGTVVRVEDLFYNIPSRRRAFIGSKKEKEEYNRVLDVTQKYAIHQSGRGVAFVCRKSGGNVGSSNDLNTMSIPSLKILMERRRNNQKKMREEEDESKESLIQKEEWATSQERDQAMRDVIGHVYGSNVARELLTFECGEGDIEAVSLAALKFLTYGSEGMSDSEDEVNDEEEEKEEIRKKKEASAKRRDMAIDEIMLESALEQYKSPNNGASSNNSKETKSKSSPSSNKKTSKFSFTYRAHGLLSNSSYSPPKSSSTFILFLNDRLVECPPLKRTIESIYADSLPKGSKPFVYLSLELPGPHVDVNVHPTKREVAFLHEDRLCDALATEIRKVLGSAGSSRTFYAQALLPKGTAEVEKVEQQDEDEKKIGNEGKKSVVQRSSSRRERSSSGGLGNNVETAQKDIPQEIEDDDSDDEDFVDKKRKATSSFSSVTPEKKQKGLRSSEPTPPRSSSAKKDPSKLVRTNLAAPAGALEPFLVKTQSQSQSQLSQQSQTTADEEDSSSTAAADSSGNKGGNNSMSTIQHAPDCEYANQPNKQIDLSIPGAFATSLCRCQIAQGHTLPPLPPSDTIIRPKRVAPTECSYSSVQNLRADLENRAHSGLATKLRDSTFVGCVSRHRSLIQWGIELLMIDHYELARELFYQLALGRFGDRENMASFGGGGIDVKVAIERALLFDNDGEGDGNVPQSQSDSANQTNMELAEQATKCLADHAEMLKEYFSIQLEWQKQQTSGGNEEDILMLTGLPILLEGHSPAPHGLPIFLLRLATEVDWTEEKPCFEGVCTELGAYYAEIPFQDDEQGMANAGEEKSNNREELVDVVARKHVQHTLFPAISFLLVPPKEFASDGTVVKLALLTSLYKVFERC